MRLFQFVKWWWFKHDNFERSLAIFALLFVLPTIITAFFIGKDAVFILLAGVLLNVLFWGIYGISKWAKATILEFRDECPPEDEAIIRKLKGIPTPSRKREDLHEYY